MKEIRRTKIIVTLGPSTDLNNNLEKLIKSGINAVRLNFSHGSLDDHLKRAIETRKIANLLNMNVAIIGDLQGPKIRISSFKDGEVFLKKGDKFILDPFLNKKKGNQKKVSFEYKNLSNDLSLGDILLLDDGKIILKVKKIINKIIITKVIVGGKLSNNKGINKLGGGLSTESLTEKDKIDISLAAKINVDYLAVSFPKTEDDLNSARNLIQQAGCNCKIIAKIERAEAVANNKIINKLILASDAIMVARGDLGVEIGDSRLIGIQKKLIYFAKKLNKIVITATQMMESMTINPVPTRAEVMDVANAVLDGTDAVMLSSETASGKYPIETVKAMNRICIGAELSNKKNLKIYKRKNNSFKTIEETISVTAMHAANYFKKIKLIIILTELEEIIYKISRIDSNLPIFYFSSKKEVLNQYAIFKGVEPIYLKKKLNNKEKLRKCIKLLKKRNYLQSNNLILIIKDDERNKQQKINSYKILEVE